MPLPHHVSFAPHKLPLAAAVSLGSLMLSAAALAAPLSYTTPNLTTTSGATSVTHNGQTFVDQGLQGVARMSATTTLDFNGDTFGAFSGMDMVPGSWRKTASGYSGTLIALPDRGPNGVGSVTFSDYPARLNTLNFRFAPDTSATSLPASADSQQQMVVTQAGGMLLKDFNGRVTTGLDPGTGASAFVTQNGMSLPGSTVGAAAGKISLDAEGLRFMNNGNFYVSDEYGANLYYFDKAGNMKGVIQPPAALMPRTAAGALSYTSLSDANTGRRLNQGLEGVALTPDNKKLVTLLQSAAMQDSTSAQQTRTNTRLMVYDISQNSTPSAPIAHYVMELPVFTSSGNGGAVNRTAAQSELLALNDTQFLVLSRDGNGLGQANLNPVFKSILLVDTAGATNIAGTSFETTTAPIATNGVLNSSITPVRQVEVLNMLNTTQLGKFGINTNNTAPTRLTLTEKWEGMALVPVLEENAPQDFFLMVGNDNDFLSSTCKVGGLDCAQAVNSDAVVLVYRMTLPTYVDSQYLHSMTNAAPAALGMTTLAAREMAITSADRIGQHLTTLRHTGAFAAESGLSPWLTLNAASRSGNDRTTQADTSGFTLGLDSHLSANMLVGATAAYLEGDAEAAAGFSEDYDAMQFSLYGSYRWNQFYASATATHGNMDFSEITRPAAYGATGTGNTDGTSLALAAELGLLVQSGALSIGPVAGLRWLDTSIDAYTETGAAGGNVSYEGFGSNKTTAYIGGEASVTLSDLRGIFRVVYNTKDDNNTREAVVRLQSAGNIMGTQTLDYSTLAQAYTEPSLTLTSTGAGAFQWWANYGARIGVDDGVEHRLTAGFRIAL